MNLNDPDRLVNLRNLAKQIEHPTPSNKLIPIVFVPGFSGWGAPLFGAINYFGGVIDIPRLLVDQGYTVIIAPVAPLSTNWERACELYSQLTFGQFSTVNPQIGSIDEVYDVNVDYGSYLTTDPAHAPEKTIFAHRRRAILYSNSAEFRNWKWDRDHKVHFICHSQGGNTVRYLISLMANESLNFHPAYFSQTGRDESTVSVTTLGTPHKGTRIIDALERFFSRSTEEAVGLVARLFATACFYAPEKRAYDLQLDHWGICRVAGEDFQDMLARMESVNGPVWKWLRSRKNGSYDNSIKGVHELSEDAINTSQHGYYFSLSFHATIPFPEDWPAWGRYVPRKDVIPILLPSVYAMGGLELTQDQTTILQPNIGDWFQNDGVVNTESMSGPHNSVVRSISDLPGLDFSLPEKRGIYWHLGVNDKMDHADQIGVFIEQSTVRL
ncbi:hypothetical protein S7711_06666 [Stachybotrys chartarum IBT 7711]|uniref:Lipase-like C-terminal domain-containing protein n=1 Tax=Stachybotrys chartarum (strain CBS 109288 / IBT 7711) TaxID=1280523 RepID=A0A084BB36_STACB|nr:hypothetical protein S7711_06666 [Stachybotrys chartarum IBT 7711]